MFYVKFTSRRATVNGDWRVEVPYRTGMDVNVHLTTIQQRDG